MKQVLPKKNPCLTWQAWIKDEHFSYPAVIVTCACREVDGSKPLWAEGLYWKNTLYCPGANGLGTAEVNTASLVGDWKLVAVAPSVCVPKHIGAPALLVA